MMSGAYSQFSKMDSDEIYAAAIQDLQEIFGLKVIYPLRVCVCLCASVCTCMCVWKCMCVYDIIMCVAMDVW